MEFTGHLLSEYSRLHQECEKGADKYARFYVRWYNQSHSPPTAATVDRLKQGLIASYDKAVSSDTWNTVFNYLLCIVQLHPIESRS